MCNVTVVHLCNDIQSNAKGVFKAASVILYRDRRQDVVQEMEGK